MIGQGFGTTGENAEKSGGKIAVFKRWTAIRYGTIWSERVLEYWRIYCRNIIFFRLFRI